MMNKKRFKIAISLCVGILFSAFNVQAQADSTYLKDVRNELRQSWPNNRTINIVFHGHSVPTGYFVTPDVQKYQAYPHLSVAKIKDYYPTAVVNSITTSIGGEQAEKGEIRFANEVLTMRPDVLFIDYALNDRNIGLERAKTAWQKMIDAALAYRFTTLDGVQHSIKVILMTPTPDTHEDILSDSSPLAQHSAQIRQLAKDNNVGLIDSYALFKEIASKESLSSYMAQANHINGKGHEVVADAIAKQFIQEEIIGDGLYYIKGNFSGKFMTLENGSLENDAKIVVEDNNDASNQKFWVKKTANGYYISPIHSKKALGMLDASKDNGIKLVQMDSTGAANQRFTFTSSDDGYYWIVNNNSTKYIATPGQQNTDGTPVIQWAFFNNLNYRWKFIPVETPSASPSIINNDNIQIYPNPTKDNVSIVIPDNTLLDLNIFSMDDKLVYQQKLTEINTELSFPKTMHSGMYLFEFSNNSASLVKKVLVQ